MATSGIYKKQAVSLLALGMPLVGSNLAHVAIGLTDTLMLGWYSVEALAAAVLAQTFWFTIFLVGAGFGFGVMGIVAQHAEAGEITELRRVTRMGNWVSVVFALAFLPMLLNSDWVLALLGQKEELLPMVDSYLNIMAFGMFPALIVVVLRSYLAALELTQIVLWVTLLAAALNIFLNWVLIFGNLGAPELGIQGAAIASLSNQTDLARGQSHTLATRA